MPEFTKGEWKAGDKGNKEYFIWEDAVGIIAEVSVLNPEWLANAHLISAAPKMYQAIKDDIANRTARYEGKSCGHQFFCICPDEAILKAIAKAEGK